jgi:hypothetical protein
MLELVKTIINELKPTIFDTICDPLMLNDTLVNETILYLDDYYSYDYKIDWNDHSKQIYEKNPDSIDIIMCDLSNDDCTDIIFNSINKLNTSGKGGIIVSKNFIESSDNEIVSSRKKLFDNVNVTKVLYDGSCSFVIIIFIKKK